MARPTPLVMPSPEQLGLAGGQPSTGAVDWAAVHRRLDEMGAACFQIEKLKAGGCRCTCLMPTSQPGRNHRVEAQAATEPEAVRLALAQVEQWASSNK